MARDQAELSVPVFLTAGLLQSTLRVFLCWALGAPRQCQGMCCHSPALCWPGPCPCVPPNRSSVSPLSCRYSNHRLHPGLVPAHRSLRVSPRYVLLLWLSSSCLYNMHSRWLSFLLFIRLGIEQKVLIELNIVGKNYNTHHSTFKKKNCQVSQLYFHVSVAINKVTSIIWEVFST